MRGRLLSLRINIDIRHCADGVRSVSESRGVSRLSRKSHCAADSRRLDDPQSRRKKIPCAKFHTRKRVQYEE
jgi:hypothetical protein